MNGHERKDLVICGCFIHATSTENMAVKEDMIMGVRDGEILFFEPKEKLTEMLNKFEMDKENLVQMDKNQFVMPGFIDTHAHAPQFSFMGTGSDLPLLPWLEKYTYPTETRLSQDLEMAGDVYQKCVARTLKNGTTSISYFATISTDSSLTLASAVANHGQRAFIGKVNMDSNSPDSYRETRETSVKETSRFIEEIMSIKSSLVTPCITPRFAVSCSEELMKDLGSIAKEYELPVQSHISENRDEIKLVADLFPESTNYTDVYHKAGLLGNKTILAHGVYLTDVELDVIKQTGTGISHCPNSNFSLNSGIMDVRKMLDMGVKVGLGTDFAGGHSPTILDTIRRGVTAANVLSWGLKSRELPVSREVTYKDMFRLATLGGAEVLGLADKIGNFEVGKQLDAVLVDPDVDHSPLDTFITDTRQDVLSKFFFIGDDRNISRVWVNGVPVIS